MSDESFIFSISSKSPKTIISVRTACRVQISSVPRIKQLTKHSMVVLYSTISAAIISDIRTSQRYSFVLDIYRIIIICTFLLETQNKSYYLEIIQGIQCSSVPKSQVNYFKFHTFYPAGIRIPLINCRENCRWRRRYSKPIFEFTTARIA